MPGGGVDDDHLTILESKPTEAQADQGENEGGEAHVNERLEWDQSGEPIHQGFCPIRHDDIVEREQEPISL